MKNLLLIAGAAGVAFAVPAAKVTQAPVSNVAQLNSALSSISKISTASVFYSSMSSLLSTGIHPSPTPTNMAQAASKIASAYSSYQSDFYGLVADLLLSGVAGSKFNDTIGFGACNSNSNTGNPAPKSNIYPKSSSDAPYDISEANLRAAIYIPSGFTYGQKPPLLFFPGTGTEACETFYPNYYTLLKGTSYADPVFVNIPQNMLLDFQDAAEYAAYAINYISSISNNRNVSIIGWSGASVVSQWATKYWPSTRKVVSNYISVSGDYHGTIEVPIVCPFGFPCAPSVLQQDYSSEFIATLRNNGGSSAYVPITSSHTIWDEVVEPQSGSSASANIGNSNGVAVLNTQLQDVCPTYTLAGAANFGHEGLLYNSPIFYLHQDALQHAPGPANLARSNAASHCNEYFPSGLNIADVIAVEATTLLAAFNFLTFPNKVNFEPPIKSYAAKDTPKK